MKKKTLILVLTIILLVGLILFVFYLSGFFSRTKTFIINDEEIELSIPIYSYSFKKDDSKISFKTLDSNYNINVLKDVEACVNTIKETEIISRTEISDIQLGSRKCYIRNHFKRRIILPSTY